MSHAVNVIIFLAILYALFFLIEKKWPLRLQRHPLWGRIAVNALMSLLAFTTSFIFVRPVVDFFTKSSGDNGFGILQMWNGPGWMDFILAFLLLDLSFYYWHRLNHEIPMLWRFHNIHHIDPDLDVSTAFRFHPGEIALSAGFRVVQISLLGVGGWTFLAYEAVFQAGTLFHHSNMRLPWGFEKVLNWVFVTPRMHGLHHSEFKEETNSNYSVVFSIWDRIHKTITPISHDQTIVGVPGYSAPADNSILRLLQTPFIKQRSYWNRDQNRL